MQVDLAKIRSYANDTNDIDNYIQSFFAQCLAEQDPPYLSDLIHIDGFNSGGVYVLQALAAKYERDRDMPIETRFRWRLKVNYDQWGNPPVPGEIVRRRIQEPYFHKPGKPMTTREIAIAKQTGDEERRFRVYVPYKIDNKGCITCEFQDAVNLLTKYGIHGKTGRRLSIHTREHSADPQVVITDEMKKQHLHVWYWRYKEVDKETYDKLPMIGAESKPKRGAASA